MGVILSGRASVMVVLYRKKKESGEGKKVTWTENRGRKVQK
jgi:hypothetical protein